MRRGPAHIVGSREGIVIEEFATAAVGAATMLATDHVRKARHGAGSPRPLFIAALRLPSRRGIGARWRHGYIRPGPSGPEWFAQRLRSIRRRPIQLGELHVHDSRSVKLWEMLWLSPELTVLTCNGLPGELMLAIPAENIASLDPFTVDFDGMVGRTPVRRRTRRR
jgi:hypothetical protein